MNEIKKVVFKLEFRDGCYIIGSLIFDENLNYSFIISFQGNCGNRTLTPEQEEALKNGTMQVLQNIFGSN